VGKDQYEKAYRGLYRGGDCPAWKTNGSCGRLDIGRRRYGAGETRDHGGLRYSNDEKPVRNGKIIKVCAVKS